MNNLCIDVKNLNKHFGEHHVVKDFSLQVAKGESMVFSVRTVAEKRHRFE
ncbi:putative ABC-type multidrug transport system ATPase component [Klebsiella pneumoniae]|nr:putative ABC-type multidrug transport system ATPase component [Klebsiella pneumoniae]